MFAHFSSLFIVRPYVICGAPLGRLERTQEDSIFLGNRSKLIRETCPAQRNCRRVRYDLIGRRSSFFCRSTLEILWILVCFLVTRHMALIHREWKQLSSCTRASVRYQDSEPYSRIVNTIIWYTNDLAVMETIRERKIFSLRAPKALPAFSILVRTSSVSVQSLEITLPRYRNWSTIGR